MKVLIDTREKKPFDIAMASFDGVDVDITVQKLDCGDYSLEGLEHIVRIERKATTGEIYLNLAQNKMKERFHRELVLLDEVKHAYIVCEFPESRIHTFPNDSGIPAYKRKYLRISAKYFSKLIYEIKDMYNIEFVFCDNREEAEKFTIGLLKEMWDKYGGDISS